MRAQTVCILDGGRVSILHDGLAELTANFAKMLDVVRLFPIQ